MTIDLAVLTQCTSVTDRQTDGHPCDSKGHGCIASRSKNYHYTDTLHTSCWPTAGCNSKGAAIVHNTLANSVTQWLSQNS